MDDLSSYLDSLPMKEGDLAEAMITDIFPQLDMDVWITSMIENVPSGHVVTFGQIAEALGTKWASRAVGERISKIKGPRHRIVYADGRVPPGNVEELSDEIQLRRIGGNHFIKDLSPSIIKIEIKPLELLSDLQVRLRPLLRGDDGSTVGSVAGTDISSKEGLHVAGLSVMELDGKPLDEICFRGRPGLPYIPGLLFYREAPLLLPLLLEALDKEMISRRTLCVMDGNGILHPKRMGVACQIGASTGLITCGVAKKLLVGRVMEQKEIPDGLLLADIRDGDEIIGTALSGRGRSKPVYLSRGHRIDQVTVNGIISKLRRTRIPEPTKRAHALCNEARASETPS